MVPREGFEPSRAVAHYPLKIACLPIPPPRLNEKLYPICFDLSRSLFLCFFFGSRLLGWSLGLLLGLFFF